MEILSVKNLSFKYNGADRSALRDINLSFKEGGFYLICGKSGCGKSTLLKLLYPTVSPAGERKGEIFLFGKNIYEMSFEEYCGEISYVAQDPELAVVNDIIGAEVAFYAENCGYKPQKTKERVAEIAGVFGFEDVMDEKVEKLSGGRKQMLNLASAMVTSPRILLLDEPTSRLDPVSAQNFISTIIRLNRNYGITVIICEHRTEDIMPYADEIIFLDNGKIIADGGCREIPAMLRGKEEFSILPSATRVFCNDENIKNPPLTVREGRGLLSKLDFSNDKVDEKEKKEITKNTVIFAEDLYFRYSKEGKDVLKGVSLSVKEGEIYALFGGNGSGKTTLLRNLALLQKPYRGKIRYLDEKPSRFKEKLYYKNISYLPQNQYTLFSEDTVKKEIRQTEKLFSTDCTEYTEKLKLEEHIMNNPLDLSGGEAQRLALLKVLASDPRLILLDEPTKGMDACFKEEFCGYLLELKEKGVSILIATHDTAFAARIADRCGLLFGGEIVTEDVTDNFFEDSVFYATPCSVMTRGIIKGLNTVSKLENAIKKTQKQ